MLSRRQRLVYFRISEEEFNDFRSKCEEEGARSISDLVRSAVKRLIADGGRRSHEQDVAVRVERLEKLIAEVSAQLQFLAAHNANQRFPTENVNGSWSVQSHTPEFTLDERPDTA